MGDQSSRSTSMMQNVHTDCHPLHISFDLFIKFRCNSVNGNSNILQDTTNKQPMNDGKIDSSIFIISCTCVVIETTTTIGSLTSVVLWFYFFLYICCRVDCIATKFASSKGYNQQHEQQYARAEWNLFESLM